MTDSNIFSSKFKVWDSVNHWFLEIPTEKFIGNGGIGPNFNTRPDLVLVMNPTDGKIYDSVYKTILPNLIPIPWTSLKDLSGQDIFFGDVVFSISEGQYYIVIFDIIKGIDLVSGYESGKSLICAPYDEPQKDLTIVGNLFENPELKILGGIKFDD